MNKQKMKRLLRSFANPVKKDLFLAVGFTEEEYALMKYLYVDKIQNQYWVSDELGISLPTLTNWHNCCVEQIVSFFNYEKFKMEHNEDNCYEKFFKDIAA